MKVWMMGYESVRCCRDRRDNTLPDNISAANMASQGFPKKANETKMYVNGLRL